MFDAGIAYRDSAAYILDIQLAVAVKSCCIVIKAFRNVSLPCSYSLDIDYQGSFMSIKTQGRRKMEFLKI